MGRCLVVLLGKAVSQGETPIWLRSGTHGEIRLYAVDARAR